MPIKWFATSRSEGEATAYEPYRLIFTEKPKGIRFNAAMTKRLIAMEMVYVRVGIDQKQLVVQPVAKAEQNAFKLIANKNSGQICSAVIGDWAMEQKLVRARLRGEWSEEQQGFIFDLSHSIAQVDEDEEEVETSSGWV